MSFYSGFLAVSQDSHTRLALQPEIGWAVAGQVYGTHISCYTHVFTCVELKLGLWVVMHLNARIAGKARQSIA